MKSQETEYIQDKKENETEAETEQTTETEVKKTSATSAKKQTEKAAAATTPATELALPVLGNTLFSRLGSGCWTESDAGATGAGAGSG